MGAGASAIRAGRPPGLGLGDPQRAFSAGRGQGGGLRDAVAAHRPEHRRRRAGEPGGQGFQGGGIEEPRRQPQGLRQRMDGRLVRLEVDGEHPRQRAGGQAGTGQRALDQIPELVRRNAALATHAQREPPPVEHQGAFIAGVRRIGHPHRERGIGLELDAGALQPLRLPLQAARFPGQQPGRERLAVVGVGEHPSRWRVVQRHLPPGLAGGGDRGGDAQRVAQATGERVGAAVAAEQRRHRAAVFRDGNDGRLLVLVGEHGGQGPDQDPGRAYPHDVHARREQPPQLGPGVLEPDVGIRHPGSMAVDPRTAETGPDPPGRGQAPSGQHHDGRRVRHSMRCRWRAAGSSGSRATRLRRRRRTRVDGASWLPRQTFHALPRACSRIIEK